jgi:glycosyltransferase involved in cell wall biosynthesis
VSKRICVVTSDVPFVEGGHLVITRELVKQLEIFGYQATLVKTPQNPFGKQLGAYLANANTNLSEAGDGKKIDGIISTRFPSFALKHERHSCWLNHRMREYYDLWPIFKNNLGMKGKVKESLRRFAMHRMDEFCLDHRVKKLYAQSRTIQTRLSTWGGHSSEVLYPPAISAPYRNDGYGDYLFAVSRLVDHKRMDMLVRAAAIAGVKVVIGGDGPEKQKLLDLTKELKVENLVTFTGRLSDEKLLDHYAKCRAVVFPSFNEDYGLITLEAFNSGKAVITLEDSGGPTEIIKHEVDGLITKNTPTALAEALQIVIDDPSVAEDMGANALANSKRYNWEDTIKKLVEWQ